MNNITERNRLLEAQSWLAEYESLQSERLENRRYAGMLAEISIAVAGVVVGLVVTAEVYAFAFLLTMSMVCSFLGLIWVAQNRQTTSSSNYIINTITPALRDIVGNDEIMNVESSRRLPVSAYLPGPIKGLLGVDEKEASSSEHPSRINYYSPFIEYLAFILPGLAGLFLSVYAMVSSEPWYWYCTVLFIVSLLLTVALGVTGWQWMKEFNRRIPAEDISLDDIWQRD